MIAVSREGKTPHLCRSRVYEANNLLFLSCRSVIVQLFWTVLYLFFQRWFDKMSHELTWYAGVSQTWVKGWASLTNQPMRAQKQVTTDQSQAWNHFLARLYLGNAGEIKFSVKTSETKIFFSKFSTKVRNLLHMCFSKTLK